MNGCEVGACAAAVRLGGDEHRLHAAHARQRDAAAAVAWLTLKSASVGDGAAAPRRSSHTS